MIHLDNRHVEWCIPLCEASRKDKKLTQDKLVASVAGFSAFLLAQPGVKQFPEIVALAFWFRKAHLQQLKQKLFAEKADNEVDKVFHIAPANVDTVFMYTLLLSVLCGNTNIVRISHRSGDITRQLVDFLHAYLKTPNGEVLAPFIGVVQYNAEHVDVTERLSKWCDLRVVWGGDAAIESVSRLAPETRQISFPDRYSVAVLQLNNEDDIERCANSFVSDVAPFTQQACSSPKALYWLNTNQALQERFWEKVGSAIVLSKHNFETIHKVEQHIALQYLSGCFAVELRDSIGKKLAEFAQVTNVGPIARCKVKTLTASILEAHGGNGLVLESDIASLEEIAYSAKLQTISYALPHGWQERSGQFKRAVPLGKALEFSPIWDGVDLLQSFSQ